MTKGSRRGDRLATEMRHGPSLKRLALNLLIILTCTGAPACGESESQIEANEGQMKFERIQTQFIAALGDPPATSGSGAETWGLWRVDPGPRGVRLENYEQLNASGGVAPAGWKFDSTQWWLEEHGLIMEKPDFPLPAGRYLVTGDREVTTVLTIHPIDPAGAHGWELGDGATLFDVTHLPCRSARYEPVVDRSCSPADAARKDFPVTPGAPMPPIEGCTKQDYAVLFVIGVAVDN